MTAPATLREFVELGCKAGLFEQVSALDFCRKLGAAGHAVRTPEQLAQAMVCEGLLTAFQAKQLLTGRWRGFLLCKKYKLLDCIGAGGMGSVYLCEHLLLRRRVAIKVLPAAQAKDPGVLQRFYREAQAVAALDHPNIVRAYDADRDGDTHFLVMEYVDGASLQDIVKKSGPLDPARAANYIAQAALGLQHAHEAGLVHRDIKPANLLLERTGVVKILDLGLARFFHDETDELTRKHDAGAVLGTADYLSPEQAVDSHAADIRADIYSLGATFYFLLAGNAPFHDKTVPQKLVAHQFKEPRPIRELRPDVAEEMAAVLRRMMAKDPALRFQQPYEVAAALAPCAQVPVSAPTADSTAHVAAESAGMADQVATRGGVVASSALPAPAGTPLPLHDSSTQAVHLTDTLPDLQLAQPATIRSQVRLQRRRPLVVIGVVVAAIILAVSFVGVLAVSGIFRGAPAQVNGGGKEAVPGGRPAPLYRPAAGDAGKLLQSTAAHRGGVTAVRFTPDAKSLLTAGADGRLLLWRGGAEHPTQTCTFGPAATAVAFTPNGDKLLCGRADGAVELIGATSGAALWRSAGHLGGAVCVAVSPDGKWGLSGGKDNLIHLWELADGRKVRTFSGHAKAVLGVAFATDGRRALSAGADHTVRLWDVEAGGELQKFTGHGGPVRAVAFAADGRLAASAGEDKVVFVWNVDGGRAMHALRGHTAPVAAVTFSPHGRHVLSAGEDATVRVWDAATGRQVFQIDNGGQPVLSLACAPDGRLLATGGADGTLGRIGSPTFLHAAPPGVAHVFSVPGEALLAAALAPHARTVAAAGKEGAVYLWDFAEVGERKSLRGHAGPVRALAFSPDGLQIYSASDDRTLRAWDVPTGEVLRTYKGHSGPVHRIALSPDGRQLLSASADGTVRLWDAHSGNALRLFAAPGKAASDAAWTPDRKRVATLAVDQLLRFWDAEKGPELQKFPLDPDRPRQIFFLGAPDRLLTVGGPNPVQVWNLAAQPRPVPQAFAGHAGAPESAALTADQRYALTGHEDGKLVLWDIDRRRAIEAYSGHQGPVRGVALSPDGQIAASAGDDGAVRVWRLPDFAAVPTIGEQRIFGVHDHPLHCLAVSPDGERVAVAGRDGMLGVWSMAAGKWERRFKAHVGAATQVHFSADGSWLLSCGVDGTARVWNAANGKEIQRLHADDPIEAVSFSPDGRLVLAGAGRVARLWDIASGKEVQLYAGHGGTVRACAFHPEGRLLLTAGDDKLIRIWERGGKLLKSLPGQSAAVTALALSPDGKLLLSAGEDNVVCLWEMATGKQLHRFAGHAKAVRALAVSPDGQYALSGGDDNSVRLWDIHGRRQLIVFPRHGFAVSGVAFTPDGRQAISSSHDRTLRLWGLPLPRAAQLATK